MTLPMPKLRTKVTSDHQSDTRKKKSKQLIPPVTVGQWNKIILYKICLGTSIKAIRTTLAAA